jgi:hypothetical protein
LLQAAAIRVQTLHSSRSLSRFVMSLTLDTLVEQPRWKLEETLTLVGTSRGDAVGGWGENLTRRFGPQAIARVRARLPAQHAQIAPVLTTRDTLPVHAQLLLTEAIVDEFLGGDMRALYPLVVEDTRAGLGRIQLALVKTIGAHRAIAQGARQFRTIYDRGTAEASTAKGRARVEFRGHPMFAHPTWRALQLMATGTLLELAGSPGRVTGEHMTEDAFATVATW